MKEIAFPDMFLQCLCLNHQVLYLASDIEISSFHSFVAHLLSSSFVPRIRKRRFTFIACSNYSGSGRNRFSRSRDLNKQHKCSFMPVHLWLLFRSLFYAVGKVFVFAYKLSNGGL